MFCLFSNLRRKRLFLFAAHLFGEAPHGELITGGGRHDQISVNGSTPILTSGIWIPPPLVCFNCTAVFYLLRVFFIGGVYFIGRVLSVSFVGWSV